MRFQSIEANRVLIVENHPRTLRSLVEMVQHLGMQTQTVSSGNEALKCLSTEHDVSLLIMDTTLPGENAYELARRIDRAQGMRPPISKLFLLKTMGQDENSVQTQNEGKFSFLLKPVLINSLYSKVLELLLHSEVGLKSGSSPGSFGVVARIHGARILLVEDNPINQQVTVECLQKEGAIVVLATNGIEAIELIRKYPFDLVLMDLQMPGMDGYQATERIREFKTKEDLPIVAMSAHVIDVAKEQCMAVGMNDFLGKPMELDTFLACLNRWIGGKLPGQRQRNLLDSLDDGDYGWTELPFDLPGIDLRSVLARLRGNTMLLTKLLQEFSVSKADSVRTLRLFIRKGDQEGALKMLHNLKGLAGNISAVHVHKMARVLDVAIREGEMDRVAELLDRLEEAMETIFESAAYLKRIESPEIDPLDGESETFNPFTLNEKLGSLLEHLRQNNIAALDLLDSIKMSLPPELEHQLLVISELVHKLDFDSAVRPVEQVLNRLNKRDGDEHVENA